MEEDSRREDGQRGERRGPSMFMFQRDASWPSSSSLEALSDAVQTQCSCTLPRTQLDSSRRHLLMPNGPADSPWNGGHPPAAPTYPSAPGDHCNQMDALECSTRRPAIPVTASPLALIIPPPCVSFLHRITSPASTYGRRCPRASNHAVTCRSDRSLCFLCQTAADPSS